MAKQQLATTYYAILSSFAGHILFTVTSCLNRSRDNLWPALTTAEPLSVTKGKTADVYSDLMRPV